MYEHHNYKCYVNRFHLYILNFNADLRLLANDPVTAFHCQVTGANYRGNAKGWRRAKMKRTLTDFFRNHLVNLSLVKRRESALWRGLGWCMRCYILQSALPIVRNGWQLGGVQYWQKTVSIFSRILSITIIRRYFAEWVIVLLLRTTVNSWLWYSSYSVW